jgi:hypothetical protein
MLASRTTGVARPGFPLSPLSYTRWGYLERLKPGLWVVFGDMASPGNKVTLPCLRGFRVVCGGVAGRSPRVPGMPGLCTVTCDLFLVSIAMATLVFRTCWGCSSGVPPSLPFIPAWGIQGRRKS